MHTDLPSEAAMITRREAIRRAALLAGVTLSPGWLQIVGRAQTTGKTYLSTAHAATLAAAADRILPRTDTPGAADVGVPKFIDVLYGEMMTSDEQKLLTAGLDEIEAAARAAHGAAFGTLASAAQDSVLRSVAVRQQGQAQSSFALLRSATVLGYFTSEEVGRKVLNYDPIPGAYDGCIPIDQVGRRNWTT